MKTLLKTLLWLLLLMALGSAVHAQFNYETNNGTIIIIRYTGSGGDVTIPDTMDGMSVTSIGDGAFWNCTSVSSVSIPNSATNIGNSAFSLCASLTNISIPGNLTSIGDSAFNYCSGLTSVTLPNKLTTIGAAAFFACSLTSVTIPDSVTSLGSHAFQSCPLTNVTIGNGLTAIAEATFWGCADLATITIGHSVTNVGKEAFWDCTSLTGVELPESVTTIGSSAFHFCQSATNLTLGAGVTTIGYRAFDSWVSLTNLTMPRSVTTIGDEAFAECSHLKGIYFQGDPPTIGTNVFFYDNTATIYYLPGSMGWGSTFGGCPTALWLPQVQTTDNSFGVRTNAFGFNITWSGGMVVVVEACTNLAHPGWFPLLTNTLAGDSFYFSDPQWTNYPARFYRLRWLSPEDQYTYVTNSGTITITGYTGPAGAVNIPGTISGLAVTAIGDHAFAWHQDLTSVTLPNTVASIATYAFFNCNFLTNVTLGSGVTDIGTYAFDSCQGLLSIRIPDNVINIGDSAFFGCTSLTNVGIGSSVTSIGGGAFAACRSLSSIAVDTNNLAYSSVEGVLCNKSQTTLVQCPAGKAGCYSIPDTVTSIGFAPFEYCTSLTSVLVPPGVISVGSGAFSECSNLTGVYFRGNAPNCGWNAFVGANNATVYYLPEATGWGPAFGGRPTSLWLPQLQTTDNSFGVRTNEFGFNITWASGTVVIVEACTSLANPAWSPVGTNALTGGTSYFSEPRWTNYPARFYRLRSR